MKKRTLIASLTLALSAAASSAYAGWLSVIGVGCTLVAIGTTIFGGPVGAGAGGGSQLLKSAALQPTL